MKKVNRKYLLAAVLYIIYIMCLAGITGCSAAPTYYSANELKKYVKNVYGKEYKLTKTDKKKHIYTFQNDKGFAFDIVTGTRHITIDSSETMFYEKTMTSYYTSQVVEYHQDEIQKLINKYDLDVKGDGPSFKFYVNNMEEFKPLADFIAELDQTLAYSFNNGNIPGNMTAYDEESAYVYIYYGYGDTQMLRLNLSSDDGQRLKSGELYKRIENSYVNCVKEGVISDRISKELWDKYPAGQIKKIYYNDKPFEENLIKLFPIIHENDIGTYVIVGLGPYDVFEEFTNTYSGRGKFAILVNMLGGTLSSEDKNSTWEIDGVTWQAVVNSEKSKSDNEPYRHVEVSRNGVRLKLTTDDTGKDDESLSDGYFTIEDLGLLLDADIKIDQTEPAAYIMKKIFT